MGSGFNSSHRPELNPDPVYPQQLTGSHGNHVCPSVAAGLGEPVCGGAHLAASGDAAEAQASVVPGLEVPAAASDGESSPVAVAAMVAAVVAVSAGADPGRCAGASECGFLAMAGMADDRHARSVAGSGLAVDGAHGDTAARRAATGDAVAAWPGPGHRPGTDRAGRGAATGAGRAGQSRGAGGGRPAVGHFAADAVPLPQSNASGACAGDGPLADPSVARRQRRGRGGCAVSRIGLCGGPGGCQQSRRRAGRELSAAGLGNT